MNKSILPVLFLCWYWPLAVFAQAQFTESFNIEGITLPEYVDQISAEYLDNSAVQPQLRLQKFKEIADQLIQQHDLQHQSVWYFIEGLNSLNIISLLKQIQVESAIDNQAEIDNYDNLQQIAFRNAMREDVRESELSAEMYATMQRALEGDSRIDALKHELQLGGSGDNESSYWFKHWQVIGALKDAGRFQEAEQALSTMQRELSDAGLQNSVFNQIQQRASQDITLARSLSQIPKSNNRPVEKKRSEIEKFLSKYWPMVLINGTMLVFIIIAGVITLKKKH